MIIVEHIKNVLCSSKKMPAGFQHNPKFDAVLFTQTFHHVPIFIRARDGWLYLYFEHLDTEKFSLIRKMGFTPRLHKSHKYHPAKMVYRVRVCKKLSQNARDTVREMQTVRGTSVKECASNPEYLNYVANYRIKTK